MVHVHVCYVHVYLCAPRKDRRVFEVYQQEARTARDRRDKEDIEALRIEVGCRHSVLDLACDQPLLLV